MSAIIVRLRKQGSEPETLRFDKEEIYIGRLEQNDITLSMTNVSKKHAVVWVDGPTIYVSDAGSTNGTYVNKRRVTQPTSITPSDEVYVGDFVFTVQFEQAAESVIHPQAMETAAPFSFNNKSGRPSMPPPPRTSGSDGAGYRTLGASSAPASPPVMRMEPHRQPHNTDSLSDIYLEDESPQVGPAVDPISYHEDIESVEFDARHLPQDTIGSSEPASEVDKTMAPLGYKDVGRGAPYAAAEAKPPYEKPAGYDLRDPGRPDYLPPQPVDRAAHNDRTNLGSAAPLVKNRRSGPHASVGTPPSLTQTPDRRRPAHSAGIAGVANRLGLDPQAHPARDPLAREPRSPDSKGARTSILGNDLKGKQIPAGDLFKFPDEIKDLSDRVKFVERETKFAEFLSLLEADGINPMQVSPLSEDLLAPYLNRLEIDEEVRHAFADELLRMGPIHHLLKDETVTEIFVNRYDQIVVKRGTECCYAEMTFHSPESLRLTARRLARRSEDPPDHEPAAGVYVDIRFLEQAMATVSIPAEPELEVLVVVQRKQLEEESLEALVEAEMMSASMGTFLSRAMASGLNVLIAGPLGSEKLRLMSSLSALLPSSVRAVYVSRGSKIKIPTTGITLQDSAQHPNDTSAMIDTAVALRPDRLFLEQIRGVEAYSWVTSVATAVEGCVTTISGSSTQDALGNLLTLSMLANHVPSPYAIKEQIARSLDLVVVVNHVCGQSRVVSISEIDGVDIGSFRVNDIFRFKMEDAFSGHYEATGYIPQSYESLRQSGVDVDISIFRE